MSIRHPRTLLPAYFLMLLGLWLFQQATALGQISNGSFESGLTGWTVTNPVGSTVTTGSGQGRTNGANAANWNGGNQLGSSSIAQSFGTTAGQRYQLQFDYGVFGANQTQQMNANVMGGGTLFNQTVTGVGPAGTNDTTFTRYTYQFTADSPSATLTFTDMTTLGQSSSAAGNLDGVSVTAVAPTTISPGGAGTLGTVNYLNGNIALATAMNNPVASQTNTRVGSGCNVAGCAIDGNTNGNFSSGNSTTHTSDGAIGNEWRVTLGTQPGQPNPGAHEFAIDHVTIFNRSDCCQDRLVDFSVDLFNSATGASVLNPFDLGNPSGGNANNDGVADNGANAAQAYPRYGLRVVQAPNTIGDAVRIEQQAAATLSLAEVQVEGLADLATMSGDVLEIDVSATGNDFLNVEGDAALADGTVIDVSLLGGYVPPGGTTFDILTAGGALNFDPDGLVINGPFRAQIDGGTLQLVSTVPEPASIGLWVLVGLGLASFGGYRLRRHSAV